MKKKATAKGARSLPGRAAGPSGVFKKPQRLSRQKNGELRQAREALRRCEETLATERDTAQRLHHVAARMVGTSLPTRWHDEILDAAIEIVRSDFASIQIFYAERGADGELRLLGHRGFNANAESHWKCVLPGTGTACGEALRTRMQVAVTDVRNSDLIAGTSELEVFRHTGIRAVQSTPLVSAAGALLGIVSTHWREPHEFTASELRACGVLARLAADRIERSRAEEALREDQRLFASIYATVRDVIFYLAVEPGSQFRFVTVNPAFVRVTGLSWESVVGKTVSQVIPEPSRTMVIGKYRSAIEEKTIVTWEETSDYPGGRLTGEVSIAPVFDASGSCTHLVGSVHDITAYKLAESRLFEQRERLEALMRSLPVGVAFSRDATCEHVTGNQMLLEHLGAGPHDDVSTRAADPGAFGRQMVFLQGGRRVDYDELPLQRAAREGRSIPPMELEVRSPDGRSSFLEVSAAPIRRNNGETIGSVAVTVDVSARKQAAEERERSRLKDEFLAVLGHELRNPLAAISTAVHLLSGGLTRVQRASGVDMVQRQVTILRRLVDDLLDVSRITHGQITLQKETIDLAGLLKFAAEMARPAVTERAQQIVLKLPPEGVLFVADRVRIQQIAANLLDNASKYSDRRGRIDFSGVLEGAEVVIRCKDTGRGIPHEMQQRIFEPLTRSDTAGQNFPPGLGLGLTLVKRLAELHGGSVRVNSAGRGKGSEFIVRLPLVAAESVPPPSKAILALETATSSFSFVVVEDNADLREVTVLSLERAGHEVTSFPDGPSSLAAIAHLQPDALLLDIGLPGLDGFEVLARMKQHPHLKDALFIGISGFQDATNRQERGARFDHYLIKPIDVATLLGLIGGHIQGKKRGALRTLLVEDHSDLAVAMAELLRGEGLEILVAETGQEALEVGPVFRPHLILCDMNLPDMKGLEVIHKLRSSPAVRGTRVAMISARREAELRIYSRKARELGVDDFISKPITRELIRTLVEKLRLSGTGC